MSEELIKRLLAGSKVIDVQKSEIKTILGLVFWLLTQEEISDHWRKFGDMEFQNADERWTIRKVNGEFVVDFSTKSSLSQTLVSWTPRFHCFAHKLVDPQLKQIRFVRAGLKTLLAGLQDSFPILEARWDPFVNAALGV